MNEENFIEDCIESIFGNTDDIEEMEVILSTEEVRIKQLKLSKTSLPGINVILLHNPKKITPISLNLAINESSGEFIIRLDAHALYSKNGKQMYSGT